MRNIFLWNILILNRIQNSLIYSQTWTVSWESSEICLTNNSLFEKLWNIRKQMNKFLAADWNLFEKQIIFFEKQIILFEKHLPLKHLQYKTSQIFLPYFRWWMLWPYSVTLSYRYSSGDVLQYMIHCRAIMHELHGKLILFMNSCPIIVIIILHLYSIIFHKLCLFQMCFERTSTSPLQSLYDRPQEAPYEHYDNDNNNIAFI